MSGFEAVVSDPVMVRCDERPTLEQAIAAMEHHDVGPAVAEFMAHHTGGSRSLRFSTQGVALSSRVLGPLANRPWSEVRVGWLEEGSFWARHLARVTEALEELERLGLVERHRGPEPGTYWMWIAKGKGRPSA